MTKEEKIRHFIELSGLVKELNTIFEKVVFVFNCVLTAEDIEFKEFLNNTIMSVSVEIFNKNFSEQAIDDLIFIFSNPTFAKALKLQGEFFVEATQKVDAELEKFFDEKDLKDYSQYNADRETKN